MRSLAFNFEHLLFEIRDHLNLSSNDLVIAFAGVSFQLSNLKPLAQRFNLSFSVKQQFFRFIMISLSTEIHVIKFLFQLIIFSDNALILRTVLLLPKHEFTAVTGAVRPRSGSSRPNFIFKNGGITDKLIFPNRVLPTHGPLNFVP